MISLYMVVGEIACRHLNGIKYKVPLTWSSSKAGASVFRAMPEATSMSQEMKPINAALAQYERIYKLMDALVIMKVANAEWVYKWREQQEGHLRAAQRPALSPEQVRDFVDRFMPTYKAYLAGLYAIPGSVEYRQYQSSAIDDKPRLILEINEERCPSMSHPPQEFHADLLAE
ncbi:hypothetical protein PINS_up003787 [Pythium insidiosum]|nr:hypothetical protein PINS_up003787 [Pythium insidiosum]